MVHVTIYVYKVTLLVMKVFHRADIWVHGLHINIYELQINTEQLKSKPWYRCLPCNQLCLIQPWHIRSPWTGLRKMIDIARSVVDKVELVFKKHLQHVGVISYCLKKSENKYHPSLLFWESQHGRKMKFHFQLVLLNNNIRDHRMDLVLRPRKWDDKVLAPSFLLDSTDIGWEFHVHTRMLSSILWAHRPLSDCFSYYCPC